MRILKTLLIIVLAIVAIVVLLGLIGADTYHVDRSTVINATPEQVYPYAVSYTHLTLPTSALV